MNKIFINSCACVFNAGGIEKYFDAKTLRRLDNFAKLALKAAVKCLRNADVSLRGEKNIALIISTGYGPVRRTCDFMDSIIDDGHECASPLAFSSSVHNSALTSISILLNIKGPCLTVSNIETSFQSALLAARAWLAAKTADKVLLGTVDEEHSVIRAVMQTNPEVFADFSDRTLQAGAAFFLLSRENKPGSFELGDIKRQATPLNPSADAFALAAGAAPLLDYDDIERITADFIKIEAARAGSDIFSVLGPARAPAQLFEDLDEVLKPAVLNGLNCLFTGSNTATEFIQDDITQSGFAKFKKHGIINFFTSGSTGIIKNCLHTSAMLREETRGLCFLFGGIKRAVSIVPSSHSYGFIFGLQVPKAMDIPALPLPPLPTADWRAVLQEGDLFITFPMFLKQLMAMGVKFPQGVTVLTSTAPCPDELIDAVYEAGAARLIEIYGASESGAIAWRERAGQPFTLLPFWNANIENGLLTSISRKNTPLKVDIPDIVAVEAGNRLRPCGRKDNAVQVAGINVYPQKVETLLKSHPAVADAVVRLQRPQEGERLKAFIVLKDGVGQAAAQGALRAFMKEKLSAHEMPRSITFGDKIPLTTFGKKRDW
ncbi:MAG: beta-ketoacyl synthase chain length factor [Elusimicrobiota bacterium]|jgi:4-coumarate--CoA ligase (photoactive yellow protein activation family)|nr:beta-ketoacyl synthase chain length factor [Elusimicrobiota bacterium]